MKPKSQLLMTLLTAWLASCGPSAQLPTSTPFPSATPAPPTRTPTPTPTPTATPSLVPPTAIPTATAAPQRVLLRRACGRDYAVRSGEALKILYGGWGTVGLDLAQEWSTALVVEITIDGSPVEGHPQAPVHSLPMNCRGDDPKLYWIYSSATLPGLATGTHDVTVTFNALRALNDGSGTFYGPGRIAQQTFRLLAK